MELESKNLMQEEFSNEISSQVNGSGRKSFGITSTIDKNGRLISKFFVTTSKGKQVFHYLSSAVDAYNSFVL